MEKQMIFAWAMIFCLAMAPVYGQYYSRTVKAGPRVEKITHLHFYFHDIRSGSNPTAFLIASPNITQDPPSYGTLFAMDDPLTTEFELTSTLVGNAQGLYLALSRDLTKFSAVFYADFTFTTGRFNGSSFSLFSRFPPTDVVPAPGTIREMAIVGGTGKFRMATGFALLRPTSSSNTVGDANVEFNVTLYHY
ncbi:hypothetical protein ERO13_D01G040600v2 [Gossypium hirsutum]|uniref:Dirigent protein n=9 Tax=Gossypium TaxID=3633 RepID=A0A1U8L7L6_GOSHI|nr:dirigent protein 15-like [Gossypium hirsutum]KAB2043850.1 hypothetical protein ES319_D01G048200v1 [Gossypium barbadense]MBA0641297.1 hypothetical protein [Gossypium klotzschianum]MBA0733573.1 hypothetical protein [Gossypium gossypioides]MBA0759016.1 hypothetical protein [Gossypium trilobum]MBA0791910.1 hypothetical protein [Gossypium harknessii]TYG82049.1 hypothetical protein ES288_D01G055600v1 [Gossypium darwinii]TYH86575.1 hypothetical protein ES332_D01G053300v1 [Gossypium tomentosum]T